MRNKYSDGIKFKGQILDYKKDFLSSPFWQKIRNRYFHKKPNSVCFICGKKDNLELHHYSYKKIKNNTTNNIIPLCHNCHYNIHFDKNGKKVAFPKKLTDYILLSIKYHREAGLYPTHLLKYKSFIDKYLSLPVQKVSSQKVSHKDTLQQTPDGT